MLRSLTPGGARVSQCGGRGGEADRAPAQHGLPGGERLQRAHPGDKEGGPGHGAARPDLLHQRRGEQRRCVGRSVSSIKFIRKVGLDCWKLRDVVAVSQRAFKLF